MEQQSDVHTNPLVSKAMENLFSKRDETGDVIFIVESEKVRAHRCVLSVLSPKYNIQFYGARPDEGEIQVYDVSAAAFREFLQFFYLDEVILTTDNIEDVLNLVKQSLVDDFITICINFLTYTMTVNNLCSYYRLAHLHDIEQLKDQCEREISENTEKVFACEDFMNCDHETLVRILELDSMRCKETNVFNACIAWARAVCQQQNIDAEKQTNLRTVLGDAVKQIRFCSMNIEEFAAIHKAHDGFFTTDEFNEIFYIIGKVKDFEPKYFNQTVRCPPVDITEILTLAKIIVKNESAPLMKKCDLMNDVGYQSFYLCTDCVAVEFYCDEKIILHGLVVGLLLNDSMDMFIGCSGFSRDVSFHDYQKIFYTKRNKTTFIFTTPLELNRHESCFIKLKSNSFAGTRRGFVTENEKEIDGVHFSIDGTIPGIITTLLFDRVYLYR